MQHSARGLETVPRIPASTSGVLIETPPVRSTSSPNPVKGTQPTTLHPRAPSPCLTKGSPDGPSGSHMSTSRIIFSCSARAWENVCARDSLGFERRETVNLCPPGGVVGFCG